MREQESIVGRTMSEAKRKPDKCPRCGSATHKHVTDYPFMPEVDWRCERDGIACELTAERDEWERVATRLADEYMELIESEYGTGQPDPNFANEYSALAEFRNTKGTGNE